jgi:Tfp pilus assembly protein PilP
VVIVGSLILLIIIIIIVAVCCCRRKRHDLEEAAAAGQNEVKVKVEPTLQPTESMRSTRSAVDGSTVALAEHSVLSMSIYENVPSFD